MGFEVPKPRLKGPALRYDPEKVRQFIKSAPTDELLDRCTIYRQDMEETALIQMEKELKERGLSTYDLVEHEEKRRKNVVTKENGQVLKCTYCEKPAVSKAWGWFKLWGKLPVFPRPLPRCEDHL